MVAAIPSSQRPPLPSMLDVDLPEPVDLQAIRSSAHRGIPRQAHHGRGELEPNVVVSVVGNRTSGNRTRPTGSFTAESLRE